MKQPTQREQYWVGAAGFTVAAQTMLSLCCFVDGSAVSAFLNAMSVVVVMQEGRRAIRILEKRK